MTTNHRTSLKQSRHQRDAMDEFDQLPAALRGWLAEARLPWSPASAKRAWRKARWKAMGREQAALRIMDTLEEERLRQDALVVERERQIALQQAQGPTSANRR